MVQKKHRPVRVRDYVVRVASGCSQSGVEVCVVARTKREAVRRARLAFVAREDAAAVRRRRWARWGPEVTELRLPVFRGEFTRATLVCQPQEWTLGRCRVAGPRRILAGEELERYRAMEKDESEVGALCVLAGETL